MGPQHTIQTILWKTGLPTLDKRDYRESDSTRPHHTTHPSVYRQPRWRYYAAQGMQNIQTSDMANHA
eukprot:3288061-Prorocentrum_lima.AAC.1